MLKLSSASPHACRRGNCIRSRLGRQLARVSDRGFACTDREAVQLSKRRIDNPSSADGWLVVFAIHPGAGRLRSWFGNSIDARVVLGRHPNQFRKICSRISGCGRQRWNCPKFRTWQISQSAVDILSQQDLTGTRLSERPLHKFPIGSVGIRGKMNQNRGSKTLTRTASKKLENGCLNPPGCDQGLRRVAEVSRHDTGQFLCQTAMTCGNQIGDHVNEPSVGLPSRTRSVKLIRTPNADRHVRSSIVADIFIPPAGTRVWVRDLELLAICLWQVRRHLQSLGLALTDSGDVGYAKTKHRATPPCGGLVARLCHNHGTL